MTRRLLIVLCLVISGVGMSSMASAATGPRGSVVLKPSALLKVGSTQCGKVNGSWISGKVTKIKSKNYFVSYLKSSQFFSLDAKKSRSTQKKKLIKLASDFKKKATAGNKKCSRYNVSILVTTTAPVTTTVPVVTTVPANTTVPVTNQGSSFKLDLSNTVALGVTQENATATSVRKSVVGSNLKSVDISGRTFDPVIQGSVQVSRVLVSPNDLIYLVFKNSTIVNGQSCIIALVSRIDGLPECIETDTSFLPTSSRTNFVNFQFDSAGAIYYAGSPNRQKIGTANYFSGWTQVSDLVVRRVKNGKTTDFGYATNPNVALNGAPRRDVLR